MFNNRSFQVKMVKDEESPESPARPVFTTGDFIVGSQKLTENIVIGYFMIKGFKTLCGIVEHVVVTKLKVD
jgi:hypothetical protein